MEHEIIQQFIEYLNCPYEYFSETEDDAKISEAYFQALEDGKTQGYVPLLIVVNDNLLEAVQWNAGLEEGQADKNIVAAYRNEMLHTSLPDTKTFFEEKLSEIKECYAEDDMDFSEMMGEVTNGETLDRFLSYWNYEDQTTYPLILAKIPVQNPWEVFAYVPFGGWNECPDTEHLMAVGKHWYETYGAIPAVITSDQLEYYVPKPVGRAVIEDLAMEQYLFCCDIVEQSGGDGTIGWLADGLATSTVWYFWWD